MNLILSTGFAVVKINAFHCLECILFYVFTTLHSLFSPSPNRICHKHRLFGTNYFVPLYPTSSHRHLIQTPFKGGANYFR